MLVEDLDWVEGVGMEMEAAEAKGWEVEAEGKVDVEGKMVQGAS